MVRGSELAFRMHCRKYNFKVLYTPMIKSEHIVKGSAEELKLLETCEGDTPLVAQLCGRDQRHYMIQSYYCCLWKEPQCY